MITPSYSSQGRYNKIALKKSSKPSKLPALSKTPAPKLPKPNPKLQQTERNDYELELKPKHRILRSMVDVDKSNNSYQDLSSLNFSFKRMSAGMKVLGQYKNQTGLLQKVFENLHSGNEFSQKSLSTSDAAKQKCMMIDHNLWANKRNKSTRKVGSEFMNFLSEFYDCFDANSNETLRLNDLVLPLVTYGVALDTKYLQRILKLVVGVKDLTQSVVTKKKFLSALEEEKLTSSILEYFKKLSVDCLRPLKAVNPCLYPQVESYISMISRLWHEISEKLPSVNASKVEAFLYTKGLVTSLSKAQKICSKFSSQNTFDIFSFESIFFKSILTAELMNIKYGIDLLESDSPLRLKLSMYQRNLLISAVSPMAKGGRRATLKEAYKFNAASEAKNPKGLSLRQLVEDIEKANEMKMKQIIYDAENKGAGFVSFKGEIKDGINSAWEIKKVIKGSNEDFGFRKKNYSDLLTKATVESNKQPYDRNVKIFRDNYLYEKFQDVAGQYLETKPYGLD